MKTQYKSDYGVLVKILYNVYGKAKYANHCFCSSLSYIPFTVSKHIVTCGCRFMCRSDTALFWSVTVNISHCMGD